MTTRVKPLFVAGLFAMGTLFLGGPITIPSLHLVHAESAQGPKIDFSSREHDFKDIIEGTESVHVFKIYNKGNAVLKIDNVKAGCGCTVPTGWKNEVAPGEFTDVRVEYNNKNRPGPFNKTITVTSNDPNEPNVTLRIMGTVKQEVIIEPRFLNVDTISRTGKNPTTFTVRTDLLDTLEIKKVETGNANLTAKVIDDPANPKSKKVELSLDGKTPLGPFRSVIDVYTNSKNNEKNSVTLASYVQGYVEAPRTIPSFSFNTGEIVEKKVVVKDSSGKGDFKIVKVTDIGDHFDIVTNAIKDGAEYEISFKTRSTYNKQGHYAGTIEIETNREDEKKLSVSYSIFIQQAAQPAASATTK